jgi:hypothetical protein
MRTCTVMFPPSNLEIEQRPYRFAVAGAIKSLLQGTMRFVWGTDWTLQNAHEELSLA